MMIIHHQYFLFLFPLYTGSGVGIRRRHSFRSSAISSSISFLLSLLSLQVLYRSSFHILLFPLTPICRIFFVMYSSGLLITYREYEYFYCIIINIIFICVLLIIISTFIYYTTVILY